VNLATVSVHTHQTVPEPWRVTLVDTGVTTLTGGRLKRIRQYVAGETFCATYGDGLSDVDIGELVAHHRRTGAGHGHRLQPEPMISCRRQSAWQVRVFFLAEPGVGGVMVGVQVAGGGVGRACPVRDAIEAGA